MRHFSILVTTCKSELWNYEEIKLFLDKCVNVNSAQKVVLKMSTTSYLYVHPTELLDENISQNIIVLGHGTTELNHN